MKFLFSIVMLVMSFSVMAASKGSGVCKTDRTTLCASVTPGNWAIHDCLYSNLASITDTTCKTNVENMNKLKTDCAAFATCATAAGPKMFIKCLTAESKAGTLTDETCKASFESLKPSTTSAVQ